MKSDILGPARQEISRLLHFITSDMVGLACRVSKAPLLYGNGSTK